MHSLTGINKQQQKLWFATGVWAILTFTFITPFCGLMFRCGCTSLWSGAADYCNVHQPGPPHCPWCVARNPFLILLPAVLVFAGQVFCMFIINRKWRPSFSLLFVVGFLAFLIFAVATGYVYKWYFEYPYFFQK